MGNLVNLNAEAGANMVGDDAVATLTMKNVGGGTALRVESSATANASITGLELSTSSVPSAAAICLTDTAFVSAVSLVFAASANWAGMGAIRVVKSDGTKGWIPILPDGSVTAAAVE